jgi:hypothetical protein
MEPKSQLRWTLTAESPGESPYLRHFLTPPNAAVAPAETPPDGAKRHGTGLGAAFYREDGLDEPRTGDATDRPLHGEWTGRDDGFCPKAEVCNQEAEVDESAGEDAERLPTDFL